MILYIICRNDFSFKANCVRTIIFYEKHCSFMENMYNFANPEKTKIPSRPSAKETPRPAVSAISCPAAFPARLFRRLSQPFSFRNERCPEDPSSGAGDSKEVPRGDTKCLVTSFCAVPRRHIKFEKRLQAFFFLIKSKRKVWTPKTL